MLGPWFGKDLVLLPITEASVPLDDINYAYGFGVYETLKVRRGILYFPEHHVDRLFHSAAIIGLDPGFGRSDVLAHLRELVIQNGHPDSNLKVMLVGKGGLDGKADLYVIELNPLFPKRSEYRDGVRAVVFEGERVFPEAKTLNMLVSTLAYRKAHASAAYDALLVDRHGNLTEGTRTNLFFCKGDEVWTPPDHQVLAGVTRLTVLIALEEAGVKVVRKTQSLEEFMAAEADGNEPIGAFLTSTSTKIMPLSQVDAHMVPNIPGIHEFMDLYDHWLAAWAADQEVLVRA